MRQANCNTDQTMSEENEESQNANQETGKQHDQDQQLGMTCKLY